MTLQVTLELEGVKDSAMGELFGPFIVYTPGPLAAGTLVGAAVGAGVALPTKYVCVPMRRFPPENTVSILIIIGNVN
jgi:hypothetical protein